MATLRHLVPHSGKPQAPTDVVAALTILRDLMGSINPNGVGIVSQRPFQFASAQHLDARVDDVLRRIATIEGMKPSTVHWLRNGYTSLKAFLASSGDMDRFLSGDLDAQKESLSQWRGWLLQRGASRVTVRTYWGAVTALFRRLEEQDRMVNPLRWLKAPKVGRLHPKSLTREAARSVLLFVRNARWPTPFARLRNIAIVSTMLFAGLRKSEVLRLRCEDVNLDGGTLKVHLAKGRYGGKDRTAYIPPQLNEALSAYGKERQRLGRGSPAYFTLVHRDQPLGECALRSLFARIRTATNLVVTPHVLRHTYATLLRQAGVSDRVAMDLLGHENLATLQRYSRVFEPEYLREAQRLTIDLE